MSPKERLDYDLARARFARDAVSFAFGCEEDLLTHMRGKAATSAARQVAMYLTHVAFGLSLQRVAVAFARDRSTVAHACHVVEDRRDHAGFDDLLDQLEASLRAAPSPVPFKLAA
jgi:chromosomal replication initiation ATPase DnaA